MRVMFLGASGEIGGAERVLLDCIRAGGGWGDAEMSVVALGRGPLVTAAAALGVRTQVVEPPASLGAAGDAFGGAAAVTRALLTGAGALPGFFRRFSRVVASLVPEVIHSHGMKTHVLAALLPRRVPVVWHLHDYVGARPVSSRLLRLLGRRCALVIAVSESVAEDARRCLPAGQRVVVVHNAVDTDRFSPDGAALDLDARSGLAPAPPGTIRIGLPATFARWKGHDAFLTAIARLNHPAVRAYIIGGPLYRTANSQWSRGELDAMVRSLGLEGRVGFTGLLTDMPAAYRALDIVVHASTRPEPFGLVIAEAMACGRALVASPAGGSGELFADGEHAIAAGAHGGISLHLALASLVDDAARRAALGERARLHAREHFGQPRFAAGLRAAVGAVQPHAAGDR
jgi:glycosyltransferase involved in cell wall biosynthesis